MLRRNFLKLSSVAAAWLVLPQAVQAGTSNYSGPLWIFVHAGGGWDPTSLCDPKGSGITAPTNPPTPMNRNFSTAGIRTSNSAPDIKYAPLTGDGYNFSTFFDTYGKDLLIINGIDAQTNGHSTGTRYAWSGNLSRQTPSMGALFAATLMTDSPLSFITFGGYDFTGGLIPATRLNNTSVIKDLAYPNLKGSTAFYSDSTLANIQQSNVNRSSLLISKLPFASSRNALNEFNISSKQAEKIQDFQTILASTVSVNGETSMRRRARIAMASYRAGLTVSLNLTSGGFDTHSNHDVNHTRRLGHLLRGIDEVVQEAQAQGISNNIRIIVGSEFGRTRGYNNSVPEGKDHWPVTSMMFMGTGIRGGRVIGESTDEHVVRGINPNTLEVDDSQGINITPAHINKALRKLAGVDSSNFIQQNFPIDAEDLDLFS